MRTHKTRARTHRHVREVSAARRDATRAIILSVCRVPYVRGTVMAEANTPLILRTPQRKQVF